VSRLGTRRHPHTVEVDVDDRPRSGHLCRVERVVTCEREVVLSLPRPRTGEIGLDSRVELVFDRAGRTSRTRERVKVVRIYASAAGEVDKDLAVLRFLYLEGRFAG
jgi:hypothetical protein